MMITFETHLEVDEVKRRILKNVKVRKFNQNKVMSTLSDRICGNINGNKIWLDHTLTLIGNFQGFSHEFVGEISETEKGSKIAGKFSSHIAKFTFANIILVVFVLSDILSLFTISSTLEAFFCATGWIGTAVFYFYLRWAKSNFHKQDEKRVIVFLENLLGTIASYEE